MQHVLPEVRLDQRVGIHARLVLGRDQHLLDLDRPVVLVADGHLRLAVRAEVRHHVAAAHLGEAVRELVRERDRHRHQLRRLARGVAEHHALVARAGHAHLVVAARGAPLVRLVHTLRDVGRLLVDRRDHRARLAVEAVARVVVADPLDRVAGDLRHVHVDGGRDLAGHHHEACVHERLARDPSQRVVGHHGVEHAVRDLVGDLVRVTLGDRLGGEQELGVRHVGRPSLSAPLRVTSIR